MKNILNNPRPINIGMKGQNYSFNGCMDYVCECLGLPRDYDYWFFSGVTGDSFLQLYIHNPKVCAWCYSQNFFGYDIIKKAFDAIGYEFYYINGITDRSAYLNRIRESIDNGIPVIARGGKDTWEANIICGYDNDHLYFLVGDNTSPTVYPTAFNELVFAGAKKETPPIAGFYRQTVMSIPSFITMPQKGDFTFGKQAFADWAESFTSGKYDNAADNALHGWEVHGTYLCMAGTNGAADGFIKRCLELNPDMTFINALMPLYAKHGVIFHDLTYRDADGNIDYANGGMACGFNITPKSIRNKEIMRPVSEKIMESVAVCDEILKVFERKADKNG